MVRPKRRKYRDNPYTLFYDDNNHIYFVIFKNARGIINKVGVPFDVYNAFNLFELQDLSELNEYDNHIEHSNLYEETLYKRMNYTEELVDDYVIRKSTYEDLIDAINKLPEIQKRRIKKYYFDEKNEYDIAKEEDTSHQAVHQSLSIAIRNLKEILKKYLD